MSTRKHNAETQYISKDLNTEPVPCKWIHKIIKVLACAWSECFVIASWYVLS